LVKVMVMVMVVVEEESKTRGVSTRYQISRLGVAVFDHLKGQ
jgi:hypothetical protein